MEDIWDKTWRLIAELTSMDLEDSEVIHRVRVESIRGFLLYVTSTYRDMTPFLKGLSLMLDGWRPHKEK